MLRKIFLLVFTLIFYLGTFNASLVFAADLEVLNGNFETGNLTGWAQVYGSDGISVVTEQKYSGNYSVKIVDNSSLSSYGIESNKVSASEGEIYIASAKVYVTTASSSIYIRFYDASNNMLSEKHVSVSSPFNQWQDISVQETAPKGTSKVAVLLYSFYSSIATMYFDNVTIKEGLKNYSFESGVAGWTQSIGSTGIGVTTEQKYMGNYSLRIVDTSITANYGMESSPITAMAGKVYIAMGKMYLTPGTAAGLCIRFWDGSGNVISSYGSYPSSLGEWINVSISRSAPAGTRYATVMAYSGIAQMGTSYFDNLGITEQITNLGPQVSTVGSKEAVLGKNENNKDVLYTVSLKSGDMPAYLCEIDINTLQVNRKLPINGIDGAWNLTMATDGSVYIAPYDITAGYSIHLYKYIPGQSSVTDCGAPVSGENFIFGIVAGKNGAVYGGTYPNAYLFKYENGSFTTFGPNGSGQPFDITEDYIRDLAFDAANDVLYVGIGAHAKLYRYELNTGKTDEILPQEFEDKSFVYDLEYLNGKVFAWITSSNQMPVLTVTKDQNNNVIISTDCTVDSRSSVGVSPLYNGKVYYTSKNRLYYYDIATKTYDKVLDTSSDEVDLGYNPYKMVIATLEDQTNYPGQTLVAYAKDMIFRYNFQTGIGSKYILSGMPDSPLEINEIVKGNDGNIYSSGFVTGNLGIHVPMTPNGSFTNKMYTGIGQAEGMTALGGNIYLGVYPGAYIYEYDPTEDWNPDSIVYTDHTGKNPLILFELLTTYEQYRPFGMANDGVSKLFIGTVPDYGKLGGAFVIYDTATGSTPTVLRNIIQDQSIISLTYSNGKVYGGSTILGGNGATPTQTEAKLFEYDLQTGTKSREIVPVTGIKSITALMTAPDGKIWGLADGYLFIYNPVTQNVEYSENKFPTVTYPNGTYKDGALEMGKDGNVYGIAKNILFKIDISTKAVTILENESSTKVTFAQDDYGNLYYRSGINLMRYAF